MKKIAFYYKIYLEIVDYFRPIVRADHENFRRFFGDFNGFRVGGVAQNLRPVFGYLGAFFAQDSDFFASRVNG